MSAIVRRFTRPALAVACALMIVVPLVAEAASPAPGQTITPATSSVGAPVLPIGPIATPSPLCGLCPSPPGDGPGDGGSQTTTVNPHQTPHQ
jgi:hypothetical protein